jgi:peptide subunit release factor 1 (eRF1)
MCNLQKSILWIQRYKEAKNKEMENRCNVQMAIIRKLEWLHQYQIKMQLGMVVHTCNPSTQEVQATLGYIARPCSSKIFLLELKRDILS